jgi:hypothetical protein
MKFSWRYRFLVITVLVLGVWGAAVNVPNAFTAGETISSAKVNENFDALEAAVTANEASITSINSSINTLNTTVSQFGSVGSQNTTFDTSIGLTSTPIALASISIPAVNGVNVSLSAHAYVEKSSGASHRYDFKIVRGDCSSTTVVGRTLWRPNNSGDTGFVADVITLTGFEADVLGPATYTLCGSDFDGSVPAMAFARGLNAIWTP